jgi:hypothetical protein
MMGSEWAPVVVLSLATLVTGGVILLRPMARRLGELLDVIIQEKRHALTEKADTQALARRVEQLEDRVQFTERLVAEGKASPGALPAPPRPQG